jgi:hypothetical protein
MSDASVSELLREAEQADDCYQVMDGVDPRDILALHAANLSLNAVNKRLRAALSKFQNDLCEGWCSESDHIFDDCQGCEARAALRQ